MVVEVMIMKEENNAPKNKWSRIFRKKWFFPALYLVIAAILLTAVIWYQNLDNQVKESDDSQVEDYADGSYDQEAKPVANQQEQIKMPVKADQAEIVTKFFDYNADDKDQEEALVHYNNRYYQSTGIDIASPDTEKFDVTAALSGTVKEVKEDPLLGNVVELSHQKGVTTYYASLGEVNVKANDKVKQGDVIGTGGKNLFNKDKEVHVHFELRKDEKALNPEEFFNQPVSKLDSVKTDEASAEESKSKEDSKADDANKEDESETTGDDENQSDSDATDESDDNSNADESDQSGSDENSDGADADKENPDQTTPDENKDSESDEQDGTSNGDASKSANTSKNA